MGESMLEACSIDKKDTGVFLSNERKTKWVVLISLFTMIAEISVGYWSGSMALLADGWHMASHTLALFLSLIVYYLYRHPRFKSSFTFGGGKILSLGGYTSSLLLILIAVSMIVESVTRFYETKAIHYNEAIIVAVVGLVVNLICALIMHSDGEDHSHSHSHSHAGCGHDHSHAKNKLSPLPHKAHEHTPLPKKMHDHNHESAYVHILTDALTSVFAIVALILGQWQGWSWLDPLVGVIGGLVVFNWSIGLIKQSGMDLLDAHDVSIDRENLMKAIEKDGSKVMDIHLWRLAPGQVGCELIIKRNQEQRSADYRDIIANKFDIHHLIIEVV
jgi:cation diffusion facilitator family transporter